MATRQFLKGGQAAAVAAGVMLSMAAGPAMAGNCNDTARARNASWDNTKADTHIVNKTSITRTVQFGVWPKGREKKKQEEITLKPGEKATLGDRVGKEGNTQFELYVVKVVAGDSGPQIVSGQNELKCVYVVNNYKLNYQSTWKNWSCSTDTGKSSTAGEATLNSEEGGISYTCEKSWQPNQKGWDTTLTLTDPS
ncbi:MAG: hypothetical protein GC201_01770 [Alphaproteobacteria bacterium]|nr:hypothetical protein [Alphaproteobacteria bacterium]